MSDPQLHLLLNRINELTVRAEAAEAEVERLTDLLESADDVVTAQDLRIKAVTDVLDTSQTDIAAELEQAIGAGWCAVSEWRGFHNPEAHEPQRGDETPACLDCETWCSQSMLCNCCLKARAEAAEAERDALRAERAEVRRLAIQYGLQPTDHNEGTEAQIRVGREILRAMGEALPPHWSDDGELEGPIGMTP